MFRYLYSMIYVVVLVARSPFSDVPFPDYLFIFDRLKNMLLLGIDMIISA